MFGMLFAEPGETPAEYQERFEGYRRSDRAQLPRDLGLLAAAGRGCTEYVMPSGNKVPLYPQDRSEQAIQQTIRRMYSASWAR